MEEDRYGWKENEEIRVASGDEIVSVNEVNTYDIDAHIAEVYDQTETQKADVELIRSLIGEQGPLRILEPFCGTGRILIPLALDGHELVGLDQSKAMLDRAHTKVGQLPQSVQKRITLAETDVATSIWPRDFDLVILGGNCFYELATPGEQEGCIISAAAALRLGGYVYLDNNHMEGDLDEDWRQPGITKGFPSGTCIDGTRLQGAGETIWWDAPRRLVRFRRTLTVTLPDRTTTSREWIQQKHPPSTGEMRAWLEQHGFVIEQMYGDRAGSPYFQTSPRAIFWAEKQE